MSWRGRFFTVLAVVAVLGAGAVAGGYNVAASAGHLPVVKALFAWTLNNSVFWRSLGEGAPAPEQQRLPVSGAGHYHLVCRQCHGAPGEPVPETMRNMVPPPPHVDHAARSWRARELFWIVKHGIKMTAMPSWPSQHRDDEVWEVVDFIRRLPELDASSYRRAVEAGGVGEVDGDPLLRRCAHCHGADGIGPVDSTVPVIAGLDETYLRESLKAYREGRRASGFMQAQASDLSAERIIDLAAHFAGQQTVLEPPSDVSATVSATSTDAAVEAGRRIARDGVPERRIPACAACHGPTDAERAAGYPEIAGQRRDYLRRQLELFREGVRGGTRFAPLMEFMARHLTDEDIDAVTAYYAALGSGSAEDSRAGTSLERRSAP